MLGRIVKAKLESLARAKSETQVQELVALAARQVPPLDIAAALRRRKPALIAEVKRASPSKGSIRPDLDAVSQAKLYAGGGASAVSVLTEARFFNGSLGDLRQVKDALASLAVPVLRKDFILEPYQVYESRAYGADAILLIVAILDERSLTELLRLSRRLGMECLVETHTEAEVRRAVSAGASVIGINNRDLATFEVDIETTHRLRPLIPLDRVVVSESGITGRGDVAKLKEWGIDAILVGEALVSAGDVTARMKEFL
jgi:indole-3-glycerol phosphate synthase